MGYVLTENGDVSILEVGDYCERLHRQGKRNFYEEVM
jgi:hypothetical protein